MFFNNIVVVINFKFNPIIVDVYIFKNAKLCLVGNNGYESNREEEREPALKSLCYKILI